MFRTTVISFLLIVGVLLSGPRAEAGPAAEALIERTATQIATGDYTADDVSSLLDTVRIARFTLGKHLRRLPEDDVGRYTNAFDRAVRRAFAIDDPRVEQASVTVLGSIDRNPRDSIVTTEIAVPGTETMTVRWRVIERDGAWRVVDIETFGIWLAIEQRAQVGAILDRRGATIDDVIRAFDRQVAELQFASQQTRG